MITSLKGSPAQIWRIGAGCGAYLTGLPVRELLGGHVDVRREATVKGCGVAVAMPQG